MRVNFAVRIGLFCAALTLLCWPHSALAAPRSSCIDKDTRELAPFLNTLVLEDPVTLVVEAKVRVEVTTGGQEASGRPGRRPPRSNVDSPMVIEGDVQKALEVGGGNGIWTITSVTGVTCQVDIRDFTPPPPGLLAVGPQGIPAHRVKSALLSSYPRESYDFVVVQGAAWSGGVRSCPGGGAVLLHWTRGEMLSFPQGWSGPGHLLVRHSAESSLCSKVADLVTDTRVITVALGPIESKRYVAELARVVTPIFDDADDCTTQIDNDAPVTCRTEVTLPKVRGGIPHLRRKVLLRVFPLSERADCPENPDELPAVGLSLDDEAFACVYAEGSDGKLRAVVDGKGTDDLAGYAFRPCGITDAGCVQAVDAGRTLFRVATRGNKVSVGIELSVVGGVETVVRSPTLVRREQVFAQPREIVALGTQATQCVGLPNAKDLLEFSSLVVHQERGPTERFSNLFVGGEDQLCAGSEITAMIGTPTEGESWAGGSWASADPTAHVDLSFQVGQHEVLVRRLVPVAAIHVASFKVVGPHGEVYRKYRPGRLLKDGGRVCVEIGKSELTEWPQSFDPSLTNHRLSLHISGAVSSIDGLPAQGPFVLQKDKGDAEGESVQYCAPIGEGTADGDWGSSRVRITLENCGPQGFCEQILRQPTLAGFNLAPNVDFETTFDTEGAFYMGGGLRVSLFSASLPAGPLILFLDAGAFLYGTSSAVGQAATYPGLPNDDVCLAGCEDVVTGTGGIHFGVSAGPCVAYTFGFFSIPLCVSPSIGGRSDTRQGSGFYQDDQGDFYKVGERGDSETVFAAGVTGTISIRAGAPFFIQP